MAKIATASEWLFDAIGAFAGHLASLGPVELSIDLGLTVVIAILPFWLGRLIRRSLFKAARRTPGSPTAEKTVHTSRAIRVSVWLLQAALTAASLYLIATVWGLDVWSVVANGAGRTFTQTAARIVIMLIVTVCAFEAAGFLIGHLMHDLAENARDIRRGAQLRTLSTILSRLAQILVVVLASLVLLSEVGLKIGPLLAGASVIGVAVGFGAQSLVKDFLTGMFMVIEDTVSVGDIANVAGFGGLVEAMTLRTIRLRDFDGTLHIFPYSEAQVIHNLTKTFSYSVFDLQVSYESDVDRAIEVMRETGERLASDPDFKDKILDPIEVVGVDGFADSGVKLKARIKTAPIQQWNVGREYNRRIKMAFDAAGIMIPYPHMTLVRSEAAS